MSNVTRRGTIILIVTGLAALMVVMFLVIVSQIRDEAQDGQLVAREIQARAMFPAALAFILESGRLGQTADVECYGWTDTRDGTAGPKGPRNGGSIPAMVMHGANGHLGGSNSWPAEGSRYRADMFVRKQPKFAIRQNVVPNPISVPPEWLQEYELASDKSNTWLYQLLRPSKTSSADPRTWSLGEVPKDDTDGSNPTSLSSDRHTKRHWTFGNPDSPPVLQNRGLEVHWRGVWDVIYQPMDQFRPEYHYALTTQPVADDLTDFTAGDPSRRVGSSDLAWFRVYRERASDHDGDESPWFDNMKVAGHGMFIITCGSGGTRGYRDWTEVQQCSAEGVFMNSQEYFDQLRSQERLLWFRTEWSAYVGGGYEAAEEAGASYLGMPNGKRHWGSTVYSGAVTDFQTNLMAQRHHGDKVHNNTWASYSFKASQNPLLNTLGTFKWFERLEFEPTDGDEPGEGNPIW